MAIWDAFPSIAAAVRKSHEEVNLVGGHDWTHAFRVGELARIIALNEWSAESISHQAGISGLCHNADRILEKRLGKGNITPGDIEKLVASWLTGINMDAPASVTITTAVQKHDARNDPNDGPVLMALMDADRVVNLDIDLLPRSGQYYHNLPVVDYRHFLGDPEATYRSPKSVFRDIAYSLDWVDPSCPYCLRTRLGKSMANARAVLIRYLFEVMKTQLAEEGMEIPFHKE